MKPVFADTSYFLAFLGEKDQYHERAIAWSGVLRAPVVTTEYVVIEVGNSLVKGSDRAVFVDFYRALRQETKIEVMAASTELQDRGAKLFSDRPDKQWSLTDCISLVVMSERGMEEALSADRDFEEAGFRALLRYEPGVE
jgi:predicted nucleic acid-binding protein